MVKFINEEGKKRFQLDSLYKETEKEASSSNPNELSENFENITLEEIEETKDLADKDGNKTTEPSEDPCTTLKDKVLSETKPKDPIKELEKITIKNKFVFPLGFNSVLGKNGYSTNVNFMNRDFKSSQLYSKRKDAEDNAVNQALEFYKEFHESLSNCGSNTNVPTETNSVDKLENEQNGIANNEAVIGAKLGQKSAKTLLNEHSVQYANEPPQYVTIPSNDGMFVCTVTYDGKSCTSSKPFSKKKDAETEAAEQIVSTIYQSLNTEEDIGSYEDSKDGQNQSSKNLPNETLKKHKNVLQEYCQQNNKAVPRYHTENLGLGFISIVKLNGQEYQGEAARTKTDAEMNAAEQAIKNSSEIHQFLCLKNEIKKVNERLQDFKEEK